MATISSLLPRHCFGFRKDVRNNVHWIEDNQIVYPAGHNIIVYNLEQRTQRFIPCTSDAANISCLALSPNAKFLAVAEAGGAASTDAQVQITVYDLQTLKRRKTLTTTEVGSSYYTSMCFSPDGRMLLAQGGAPEWNLVLWIWEKAKVGSVTKAGSGSGAVLQCLMCPNDTGLVSVLGNNSIKMLRASDNSLKGGPQPLAKRDPQEYLCHCWTTDGEKERLLIGCLSGEILLVEALDLKAVLHTEGGASCDCIVPFSKGFIVGQGDGAVTIFERDDSESFRRTKVFKFREPQKVLSMAVSLNEAVLAVTTDQGQILTLAIGNMEILKPNDDNFEPLAGMNLPSDEVTGLDVCIRKPLVATCSLDKTVRIWNWQDSTLELSKSFQDEAFSVALHPNGLVLLVGFADKLRLMTILMDDLKLYREFSIKQCRVVCFSNGGHLFAAVNGPLIQVYNTYTCENVSTLRGHNGKVTTLFWSKDDTRLTSAGKDGAVYEWRLADNKREKEHVLKGCQYNAVIQTPDNFTMLAVGSDCRLKEMEEQSTAGTQIRAEHVTTDELTNIHLVSSGKLLFATSATGYVRSYKWPFTGEMSEMKFHHGAVTCMRVFYDENLLFTAGIDGSLFVYNVRTDIKGNLKRDLERLPFADEVMVTKADLEEKKARYNELDIKYNEQLRQNQITVHIKDLETREKIKELTEKFALESESEQQRYELLQQQKVEAEMEFNDRLKAEEEKKQQQLAALDSQYQSKIMVEVERYQTLLQEKETLNQKWDEQNATLVEAHEKVVQEITEEFEAKLLEEQMNFKQLQQVKEESERESEEVKRQLEEDADREIESLKERYESKLEVEKKLAVQLKGENGLMRKRFNGLEKAIDEQKSEIRQLHEAQDRLYTQIATHEKDILAFKEEIKERDNTISEKEKRIYDLKKKNQELEKFKFVLDHKIKELKKQIEPKEEEIADMKEQIKEMDQELERYHKTNAQLDLTISDLKLKQDGLQREVLSQRGNLGQRDGTIKRLQHDLHDVVQSLQNPKALKEKIKGMYQRHITSPVVAGELDEALQREYNRQRDYLEKTVRSLKNKLDKDMQLHRTDNLRVMQENVALIKEINELRREIKVLKTQAARRTQGSPHAVDQRDLEMQRELIGKLRAEITSKEDRIAQLEAQIMPRPMSRERLPPMEGFNAPQEIAAQ